MKYMDLDQKGYCMAEYIWIDGRNGVRSKTKVRFISHRSPTYSLIPRLLGIAIFQKRSYRTSGRQDKLWRGPSMS